METAMIEDTRSTFYSNKQIYVPVRGTEFYTITCGRCGGSGGMSHYAHIDNGVCYGCGGRGTFGSATNAYVEGLRKQKEARDAKKEAKRLALCAKRDERVLAFAAAEPELAAVLESVYNDERAGGNFYRSLAEQLHNAVGKALTENQINALRKAVEQDEQKKLAQLDKATAAEFIGEEGEKVVFDGEVVFSKLCDGLYGSSMMVVIKVSETVTVKTFSTAAWVWTEASNAGTKLSLKGTVKKNEIYEGVKSSLLTRVSEVR